MLQNSKTFSGFSVDDSQKGNQFYGEAVDELRNHRMELEYYDGGTYSMDEKGLSRNNGPKPTLPGLKIRLEYFIGLTRQITRLRRGFGGQAPNK